MSADPHEHGVRLPQHRKDDAAEALLVAANAALASADLPTADDSSAAELPLAYIVGVPRSGTTLLHQLVARHLDIAYIDNVVARFWLRPSVGIAVSNAVHPQEQRELELVSRHGVTDGAAGPHEFGYFWRHWLRLDTVPTHHLDAAAQGEIDAAGLRHALRSELLAHVGNPLVFKNVICGFHASLLTRVHARSVFVHVTRDLRACVRSILASRAERYGTYETWWSLKPSTYPFLGMSPVEQVVRQAIDSLREFEAELSSPGVQALEVSYDELCAAPADQLERIRAAIGNLGGITPEWRPGSLEPLRSSAGPELPAELEREIDRLLEGS